MGIDDRLAATAIDRPVRHAEVIRSQARRPPHRGPRLRQVPRRHHDMTHTDCRSAG
ncbi:hypothetical protein ABZ865_39635 [Streptomyces sp. NPDC047085]|uniref:hypothetical protein n=1 Tax=Streptomyces sp. NPDC047085 TaxID=3155140 RepID=UPI0034078B1A